MAPFNSLHTSFCWHFTVTVLFVTCIISESKQDIG